MRVKYAAVESDSGMRRFRIFIIILFFIVLVIFIGLFVKEWITKDATYPVISFDQEKIQVSVHATDEELRKGVSAYDEKDGDVTDSIIIEGLSRIVNGKRTITYVAFDSDNNISKASREISYTDYEPPKLSVIGSMRLPLNSNISILTHVVAWDCIDGDISNKVRYEVVGTTYVQQAGTYTHRFWVTNSAGDTTELTTEVTYYQMEPGDTNRIPKIILTEETITVPCGTEIIPRQYLKELKVDNEVYALSEASSAQLRLNSERVGVTSNVDAETPGTYTIQYLYTSTDGYTGYAQLTVIIEEEKNARPE